MTAFIVSFIIRLAPELNHLCVSAHIFMVVGLFVFILLSAMQCLQELHATCIFVGFHKSVGLQTLVLSFQHGAHTHTGVTVCRLIKIAGSFGIVHREHGEE